MQTAPRRNWLHRVVNVTVAVILLAVAAGTFFLSYPGVHDVARAGGVSGQLSRFYPAVFDAVLVIACVAAVTLRDARWWARAWAWLVAILILAAIGFTDVVHAAGYALRPRPTEGAVAAAPVAAVLLAFSLFLTMLRQSRPQMAEADGQGRGTSAADDPADQQSTAPMTFTAVDIVPAVAATTVQRPPAPPIALPPVPVDGAADPAPTAEIPALADDAPEAPADQERNEGPQLAEEPAPSAEPTAAEEPAPSAEPTAAEEPAPTDEPTPTAEPTPRTDEAAESAAESPATVPQPIRYASSAAAEQFGDEDWEAEVDPALAGQVYPVLTSDPDIEVPPHEPGQSQDLEDDAPPFVTAPFASVPRLNRVRVSPTPPTEEIAVADDRGDGE